MTAESSSATSSARRHNGASPEVFHRNGGASEGELPAPISRRKAPPHRLHPPVASNFLLYLCMTYRTWLNADPGLAGTGEKCRSKTLSAPTDGSVSTQ